MQLKCTPQLPQSNMPKLRSAAIAAALWQCQGCCRTNNAKKNERHCSSCRARRDGIAAPVLPASPSPNKEEQWWTIAAFRRDRGTCQHKEGCMPMRPWRSGTRGSDRLPPHMISHEPLPLVGLRRLVDENNTPNIASPCRGQLSNKEGAGGKRKSPFRGLVGVVFYPSPFRGLGGVVFHPPPAPLPPALLQPKRSIAPADIRSTSLLITIITRICQFKYSIHGCLPKWSTLRCIIFLEATGLDCLIRFHLLCTLAWLPASYGDSASPHNIAEQVTHELGPPCLAADELLQNTRAEAEMILRCRRW